MLTTRARAVLALLLLAPTTLAQNFTEAEIADDIVWHNRYHALLAMAAYGDYNETCTTETFTAENLESTFPGSTEEPWTILETFGPTESGCEGFVASIASMNKVTLVFKGDYNLEKNMPNATTSFDTIGHGAECPNCTVNAFAAKGYMECRDATNGFAKSVAFWKNTTKYFSITGHGLGGMHSLIASVDLGGAANVSSFVHSMGAPRTFNAAGATYYNSLYGGTDEPAAYWLTERSVSNGDSFVNMFPQSDDYTFTEVPFLWYGVNSTFKMNRVVCGTNGEDEACMPIEPINENDHYYYFENVGGCGGSGSQNNTIIEAYIASAQAAATGTMSAAIAAETAVVASSSSSVTADLVLSTTATGSGGAASLASKVAAETSATAGASAEMAAASSSTVAVSKGVAPAAWNRLAALGLAATLVYVL